MILENIIKKTKQGLKGLAYCAVIGASLIVGSAKATEYEIINLFPPDPNINFSYTSSINNDGEIVGVYGEKEVQGSTIWEKYYIYKDGVFKEINIKDNYPKIRINDFGEILAGNPDPNWTGKSSAIYKIDGIIGLDFWGSDINNKGEVCGYYGYLFKDGEKINLYDSSDGYGVYGEAINDSSKITGYTYGKGEPHHAYIWDNYEFTILESPPGHSWGFDINNKGEVAGQLSKYPCWWDIEGNIHLVDFEGRYDGTARAINDNSQLVGGLAIADSGRFAFLSENDEVVILNDYLLEDSEWESLQRALDINNKGQIIGYGYLKESEYGNINAFLANPILKTKTQLQIDIKPGSCENPFNVKSKGVLPVVVLGSEDFDVGSIDLDSIRLQGVAPIRTSYEDILTPIFEGNDCNPGIENPDGYNDLKLKFRTQEIVNSLSELVDGEIIELNLGCTMHNNKIGSGTDYVLIKGNHKKPKRTDFN
jgi:uncharacterized membrane protein